MCTVRSGGSERNRSTACSVCRIRRNNLRHSYSKVEPRPGRTPATCLPCCQQCWWARQPLKVLCSIRKEGATAVENDWQAKKQQRFEAELLNMTLRRALLKEQKVAKALTTIMHKRPSTPHSVMHETRGASCSQSDATTQLSQCSHCCNTTTLHINPATVRCEIEATLQRMNTQANTELNGTAADSSLSFNFDVRLDPIAGPTTTTTPINCTLDHAVKLLGLKGHVQV